jgi:hypothetical protein
MNIGKAALIAAPVMMSLLVLLTSCAKNESTNANAPEESEYLEQPVESVTGISYGGYISDSPKILSLEVAYVPWEVQGAIDELQLGFTYIVIPESENNVKLELYLYSEIRYTTILSGMRIMLDIEVVDSVEMVPFRDGQRRVVTDNSGFIYVIDDELQNPIGRTFIRDVQVWLLDEDLIQAGFFGDRVDIIRIVVRAEYTDNEVNVLFSGTNKQNSFSPGTLSQSGSFYFMEVSDCVVSDHGSGVALVSTEFDCWAGLMDWNGDLNTLPENWPGEPLLSGVVGLRVGAQDFT